MNDVVKKESRNLKKKSIPKCVKWNIELPGKNPETVSTMTIISQIY